ncbi:hypothetical protein CCP3SC1_10006 [Gammaproteobacteria bacterium]
MLLRGILFFPNLIASIEAKDYALQQALQQKEQALQQKGQVPQCALNLLASQCMSETQAKTSLDLIDWGEHRSFMVVRTSS